MSAGTGDLAILYVFGFYLWGGVLSWVTAAVGGLVLRRVRARRMARFLAAPAQGIPAQEAATVKREVEAAIQSAALGLQDFEAGAGEEREVSEGRVLADLARVDALLDRLNAFHGIDTASYTPVIARLHTQAAKNGLERTGRRT